MSVQTLGTGGSANKRRRINESHPGSPTLPPTPTAAVSAAALSAAVSLQSPDTDAADASLARRWQRTIENIVPSIVSVRFMIVSSFDTEPATISEATGFIVDAERGIVLTNRHVVGAGPFVGTIVCHDHEEVDAIPIYRDPIHDFGFLKFDPSKIKYMPVRAIPLRPDLAKVGLDIRVCGNDAGEKLSILAGAISRMDRNSPEYGDLTYNDFNTFYLQAASSSSGGSSGSPVIDVYGNAVALQAGGSLHAATNFFIPLNRVVRALRLLQQSPEAPNVPRGTIQTRWLHRPYDEARRLGLNPETEQLVRTKYKEEIGMLVVENVVPETSPAFGKLEEGDILIRVNGEIVTQFVPLEATLDDHIGSTVTLQIERGGVPMTFDVPVGDLHAITPSVVLEVGGAKFNNLSYQLARYYGVPVRGVYVAESGGVFRFAGFSAGLIIHSIDSQPVDNIDDMIRILQSVPDHDRVPVTFYAITDVHAKHVVVVTLDKTWAPFRMATRNDTTGLWDYTDLNTNPVPERPLTVQNAVMPEYSLPDRGATLMRSIVKITSVLPVVMDGFPKSRRVGYGLVVDAQLGLVVCARAHVPYDLADVTVTFWDSAELPARVVFVHPVQNIVVIQYPAEYLNGPVLSAALDRDPPLVKPGQKVDFLGMTDGQRPVHVATNVTDVTLMVVPCSGEPRARAINFEGITCDNSATGQCFNGVVADPESGKVLALWLNYLGEHDHNSGKDREYAMGLPACDFANDVHVVIDKVRALKLAGVDKIEYPLADLGLACLNIELGQASLVKARTMGVAEPWLERIQAAKRWHVLIVKRIEAQAECDGVFEELDLVLAINGELVTSVRDFARLTGDSSAPVVVDIVRKKQAMQVTVTPSPLDQGTDRCVVWCGALIQPPHKAARQQCRRLPSGCYVSGRRQGSPSVMYGLGQTMFITQINDQPTPDLDAFLSAVQGIADGTYVRVKLVSFDFVPVVISVKVCQHYFPTVELRRKPGASKGWQRVRKQGEVVSETGVGSDVIMGEVDETSEY
ncbi:hypothetical protein BCR44DRAFT_116373 [Catenaria anguillulae PL171]|uniref:PDZ domain-containing protein n=1 Tax=Catenaria anguillulae PL171 TaxID=765915 RepID=A0A1Y2HUF1_9FUNG|nr:hypothetical protein BCR44DRAFT_116373 [Catenaria anguillulae PL171]